MDILTLVTVEQSVVSTIVTRVLEGDVRAADALGDVMSSHIRGSKAVLLPIVSATRPTIAQELDIEHAEIELLIRRCSESPQGVVHPSRELADASLVHTQREAETVIAAVNSTLSREQRDEAGAELSRYRHASSTFPPEQDPGASSDGDSSWASAPQTQDPAVDRSVSTVIARTQGA